MPYSKDIRTGHGWFKSNINWFYDYLDNMSEELIVKTENFTPDEIKYHDNTLSEEIELRLNDYIGWKVFGEIPAKLPETPNDWYGFGDYLPEHFDEDPYGYVYHYILILIEKYKTWYELRSTIQDSDEDDDNEETKLGDCICIVCKKKFANAEDSAGWSIRETTFCSEECEKQNPDWTTPEQSEDEEENS